MIGRFLGWLGDRRTLGFGLLLAWAIYFTVISFGNLVELLWSFGWIDWANRSGNLHWIAVTTEIWVESRALNQLLLAGAVAFEGVAAALLWRALAQWMRKAPTALGAARAGFIVGTAVWLAYAIITELTVSYQRGENESDYWVICSSSLASLLVIALLARCTNDEGAIRDGTTTDIHTNTGHDRR